MSNELVKKLNQEEQDIMYVIINSEVISAKEISEILNIEESKVIEILNNDDFYNLICANSLANLRLSYHSKGIPHLIKDLDDDKDFYNSFDRVSKIIGAVKERDHEALKVSLELLLKKEERNIGMNTPHNQRSTNIEVIRSGNIFEIPDDNKIIEHSHKEIEFEFEDE